MIIFVRTCSGGLLCPVEHLLSYYSYCPSHRLVISYVGHSRWCGVLQQLMMDGWNYSHLVDPWPPENGAVGRFDVKDTELCDDIVWIRSDQKFDCAGRTGFTPVESIEKQLGLRDDHLLGQLRSILHSSRMRPYRILTLLPPLTKIFNTLQQPICIITTKASLCEKCTTKASSSEKKTGQPSGEGGRVNIVR